MGLIVVPYDPDWKNRFETLRRGLMPAISAVDAVIEHVGSTAVDGLAAKPVIDVDIIIKRPDDLPGIIAGLAALGYEHRGDLGIDGREAFRCLAPPFAHNLYVCLEGCTALRNHLALRDHLRKHAKDRERYAALKLALAQKYSHDIDSYVEGKTAFILGILRQYGFTPTQIDSIETANRK